MKIFYPLFVLLFFLGCATYNPGGYADILAGKHPHNVPINAYLDDTYSDGPYSFVNFTFSNENEEWVRVNSIQIIHLADKNGKLKGGKILYGNDLVAWSKSMQTKIAIDNNNRQVFLSSLGAMAGAFGAYSAY